MGNELVEQKLCDLQELGNFEIRPCGDNLSTRRDLVKLDMGNAHAKQINGLFAQAPAIAGTVVTSNAWVMRFPEGVNGSLMQYNTGGWSNTVIGSDGRFVAQGRLYPLAGQAVVLGAFTAMSIASGQYFLAQINSEMKMMNEGIEKILEFLYGDKKAELISEISFVKYAHKNYASIYPCSEQRIATLASLQNAKKVAMKDMEFYLHDLEAAVNDNPGKNVDGYVDKAFRIKDSLDLSAQLYISSVILEVYYSGNTDPIYISNLEEETCAFINKYENNMLRQFGALGNTVGKLAPRPLMKFDKDECVKRIEEEHLALSRGEESEFRKTIKSALKAVSQPTEYYINSSGEVYMKA